jgi:hypothetical protein
MKTLIRKYITIIFLNLLLIFSGYSQSISPTVIASSGNYSTNSGYSLSSTIGELIVPTFSSSSYFLTQGFQQPSPKKVGINEYSSENFIINVYPNPAIDVIYIEINNAQNDDFIIEMYDLLGQRLNLNRYLENLSGTTICSISLEELPIAIYVLKIYTPDNRFQKSVKINKAYY